MEKTIQRLKDEKIEIEAEYYECGIIEGYELCQNAPYRRIQCMLNWNGECWPEDEWFKGWVDETIECDDLMDYIVHNNSDYHFNDFAEAYFIGFREAVKDFWNEVEPELRKSR
ncbi:hypothetical protein DSCA_18560 [Desulfosarcina alkanivorans]|uniref:Uncharacterized protein n=1 Tax=Desulfosarcina alkanivorans TaxID=571177 RepID=A0A5K7YFV1_9BACT|nr:hypothetical protein [Desulfosarcina alkanivorans]BBO67926.1 hypothetical protein DSCA_18560 [Desulfosarcina alkanivorans]